MRNVVLMLLAVVCIGLSGCSAVTGGQPAQSAAPSPAPATPEQTAAQTPAPCYTIPVAGDPDLRYDLYRDCRPAEEVFAVEKFDLPPTLNGQPCMPVCFLPDGTLLVYLEAETGDGTSWSRAPVTMGSYTPDSGQYRDLVSAPAGCSLLLQTCNERYLVYRETETPDDGQAADTARLCVYDLLAGTAQTVYTYPKEFLESSASFQNSPALAGDQLYFDALEAIDGVPTFRVYCADLQTLALTPCREDAHTPLSDGENLWALIPQGDSYALTADGAQAIPLPGGTAEIAMGDAVFFKVNRDVLPGDQLATWELRTTQQDQPLMITQQVFDDLHLQGAYLSWATYVYSPVFLFDTRADCFLRFDSLPQGCQYLRFANGCGFLQLLTKEGTQYYRLTEKA